MLRPKRPLVIDCTKDLPLRARPLSPDAVSEIFGGSCKVRNERCQLVNYVYDNCCQVGCCGSNANYQLVCMC